MSITKRLLEVAESAFTMGAVLISDAFDDWFAEESREALIRRLRENAEHGAELALENEQLRDDVDRLRFNGPSLWKDEVELLKEYATVIKTSLAFNNIAESADERARDLKIIQDLLDRCDHMPLTAAEMDQMASDAISGRIKDFGWDDIGRDVDFFPEPGGNDER